MITSTELKKLRKKLPSNYAKVIQGRLEKETSFSLIYKVIGGKRYNKTIIDEAYILAKETTESIENTKSFIKNL